MNAAQLFGRLHPMVPHFPIALLPPAAVEGVRCFRADSRFGRLTLLLAPGAIRAVAAAGTGWFSRIGTPAILAHPPAGFHTSLPGSPLDCW